MDKCTTANCIYEFTADKFPMIVKITDRVTGKTAEISVENQYQMDGIYLIEKIMFMGKTGKR